MQLSVKMDDEALRKKLNSLEAGLLSYKEPLEEIGNDLLELYGDENFSREGTAVGSRWKPLSISTLQARARRTGHYANTPISTSKILVWTGALKSGFEKTVSAFKLIIENKVDYFQHVNEKRPMFGINSEVKGIVTGRLSTYINSLLK